ncbi:MAG: hypothetical protein ACK4SY_03320 [Pyrobaculum sp.]
MDIEEAARWLEEKARGKSFRKAVGAKTAEAVEMLARYYQCGGCLTEREVAELVNSFYIFESRLKRLLDLYDRLSRGALRAVVREILGEEVEATPVEYDLLFRELERYRKYLFSIAERVTRCHSSASSKA